MKNLYSKPEMRLSLFSENDVITTSEGGVKPLYTSESHASNYANMGDRVQSLNWDSFVVKMSE